MPDTTVTSAPRPAPAAGGVCESWGGPLSAAHPLQAQTSNQTMTAPPTQRWRRVGASWRLARLPEPEIIRVVAWQLLGVRGIERSVLTSPGRQMHAESASVQAWPGGDQPEYPGNDGGDGSSPRSESLVPCHSSRVTPGGASREGSASAVRCAVFDVAGRAWAPTRQAEARATLPLQSCQQTPISAMGTR